MNEAADATGPGAKMAIRPTTKSEWTLIGALIAACILALAFGAVLTFPAWPDDVAQNRIHFLGWALLLSIGGILLVTIAIISPWVGTVKASGMGADLEIDGTATRTP